jgi:hypothetical protein
MEELVRMARSIVSSSIVRWSGSTKLKPGKNNNLTGRIENKNVSISGC